MKTAVDRSVAGRGLRALVVDDERDIREAIATILEQTGYRADVAADGQAALPFILTHQYDLVISDVHMPRMNGMELYRRLSEIDAGAANRFVLLTGNRGDDEIGAFLARTGLRCLEKPFSVNEVRRLTSGGASQPEEE